MSEFKFGYESQNHKIEIQIPVCLFGKPDSDLFTGLISSDKSKEEPVEEKKGLAGIFKKKKEEPPVKDKSKIAGEIARTSTILLTSMVLAALKD